MPLSALSFSIPIAEIALSLAFSTSPLLFPALSAYSFALSADSFADFSAVSARSADAFTALTASLNMLGSMLGSSDGSPVSLLPLLE